MFGDTQWRYSYSKATGITAFGERLLQWPRAFCHVFHLLVPCRREVLWYRRCSVLIGLDSRAKSRSACGVEVSKSIILYCIAPRENRPSIFVRIDSCVWLEKWEVDSSRREKSITSKIMSQSGDNIASLLDSLTSGIADVNHSRILSLWTDDNYSGRQLGA